MFAAKKHILLYFSVLTSLSNLDKIKRLNWKPRLRVFPKQDTTAAVPRTGAKARRTAGSNAEYRSAVATSVALLMELKAQVL